jgi:catechol 2,3-dioxygenase-like lactoylglutathione lyase family enzyme
MAIIGMHALIYSKKADETRAFLRNVLGFASVDGGHGWVIFAAPPAELAVHPAEGEEYHELYLMCDDVDATVAALKAKGVSTREIRDQGWGRVTQIVLPSGDELGLYEPRHPMAIGKSR